MKTGLLVKYSGILAALAAVLFVVGFVIHPATEDSTGMKEAGWIPAHALLFIASVFGFAGWIGIYSKQSDKTGSIGLIGFVLLFAGTVLLAEITYSASVYAPIIALNAPQVIDSLGPDSLPVTLEILTVLLVMVGGIIFGYSSLLAKVFQKWPSVLVAVGALLLGVGNIVVPGIIGLIGAVIFAAGQLWMGVELYKKQG